MKRIYKNWPMHNLIGHPLMQIFEWLGMPEIATRVHDETLPANLVIAMAAADAEALAEDLVHAAARARDRDAQRKTKGRTC